MNKLENDILKNRLEILKTELQNKNVFSDRNINEEQRQLSFTFVVYAFQRFINNYNIDEIIDDITEGGGDNNIDVFNIQDEDDDGTININLFQVKYKTEKNLEQTIGENDIQAFISKIRKLIIFGDLENINLNPYINKKYDEFMDIVKSKDLSSIKLNLYLVTNGKDLNDSEIAELTKFVNDNNIIHNYKVLNDYNFFVDKPEKEIEEIQVKISDDIIKMNHNISACIVSFKTYELAKLYEKFKDRILEKNVRKLLGGEINSNISESLLKDPKMFWYKNNGLSIVCRRWEDKTIGGDTVLILENPYIVNGGQTTKTIYNLYKESENKEDELLPFHKSYVMARVYQTTDADQMTSIVRGTNNQNKITLYDLKSTNENLKKIKEFFNLQNISMLIQRDIEETKKEKSINSDFLLQIYCSIYKRIPHRSKISKSKLIEDYYDEVYSNPNIHNDLLNSFYIYEYVRTENKKMTQSHLNHSLYSMLYLIGIIEPKLQEGFDKCLIEKSYKEALNILDEIVENQSKNDKDYTHHNFFKAEKSTIAINNYFTKTSQQSSP